MVTINKLKAEFDKRNHFYSEEFTTNNYDDKGEIIDKKIPTLTTEYCEIGFNGKIIYLVFIAQSNSWSTKFFEQIKKFSNLQIYGFKKFEKNYNLSKDPESDINSEQYFQMQFSFDVNNLTVAELLNEYDLLARLFKEHKIAIVNQLKKMQVS